MCVIYRRMRNTVSIELNSASIDRRCMIFNCRLNYGRNRQQNIKCNFILANRSFFVHSNRMCIHMHTLARAHTHTLKHMQNDAGMRVRCFRSPICNNKNNLAAYWLCRLAPSNTHAKSALQYAIGNELSGVFGLFP